MALRWDREVSAAVNQAHARYGVAINSALVHGVIERESGHRDTSTAGTLEPNGRRSYGPMQVMDTTGQMHGISDASTMALPSVGIRMGTYELARLLKLFAGDTPRAIAAYNAGAGNAARNAAGRFFNQAYVDAVIGFWNRYRTGIMVGAPVALIAGLVVWVLVSQRRKLAWR